MDTSSFTQLVKGIVKRASELRNKHTREWKAVVNYACIFTHSDEEYLLMDKEVGTMGSVAKETKMGNVYLLHEAVETAAGPLKLLKVRRPDAEHPEQGDADFTVADYPAFKKEYLNKPGFKLITRPDMEMIELVDKDFDVRAYFSHPVLANVLGINLL